MPMKNVKTDEDDEKKESNRLKANPKPTSTPAVKMDITADMKSIITVVARRVYDIMGPGYIESVYQKAMEVDLGATLKNSNPMIMIQSEVCVPYKYGQFVVGYGRADLVLTSMPNEHRPVISSVVVELKARKTKFAQGDYMQLNNYINAMKREPSQIPYIGGLLIMFGENGVSFHDC